MKSQKEAIMDTLLAVAMKYGKPYCFPSQDHILRLLRKRQHLRISKRTLNRRLSEMVGELYIERVRRIRDNGQGKPVFSSTLYKFTGRVFNQLASAGVRIARLFTFFRLPKMANYRFNTERDLSAVDNPLSKLLDQVLKGSARSGT